jgi:hypothetical protein
MHLYNHHLSTNNKKTGFKTPNNGFIPKIECMYQLIPCTVVYDLVRSTYIGSSRMQRILHLEDEGQKPLVHG